MEITFLPREIFLCIVNWFGYIGLILIGATSCIKTSSLSRLCVVAFNRLLEVRRSEFKKIIPRNRRQILLHVATRCACTREQWWWAWLSRCAVPLRWRISCNCRENKPRERPSQVWRGINHSQWRSVSLSTFAFWFSPRVSMMKTQALLREVKTQSNLSWSVSVVWKFMPCFPPANWLAIATSSLGESSGRECERAERNWVLRSVCSIIYISWLDVHFILVTDSARAGL